MPAAAAALVGQQVPDVPATGDREQAQVAVAEATFQLFEHQRRVGAGHAGKSAAAADPRRVGGLVAHQLLGPEPQGDFGGGVLGAV
jgi:hypothetical protein